MKRSWHLLTNGFSANSRVSVEFARLVRFGIVGIIVTAVYFSTSVAMVEAVGLPPVAASVIGQIFAVGVSYFGHAEISFRVEHNHRRHAWRFLVTAAATLCLNIFVTWFLTDMMRLPYLIAFCVIVVLIPAINFTCNRFWVFKGGIDKR